MTLTRRDFLKSSLVAAVWSALRHWRIPTRIAETRDSCEMTFPIAFPICFADESPRDMTPITRRRIFLPIIRADDAGNRNERTPTLRYTHR